MNFNLKPSIGNAIPKSDKTTQTNRVKLTDEPLL